MPSAGIPAVFPGTAPLTYLSTSPGLPQFLTSFTAFLSGSKGNIHPYNMVGAGRGVPAKWVFGSDVIFPVIECFIEFSTMQLQMQEAANSFC